jgi:DUF2924 family protein
MKCSLSNIEGLSAQIENLGNLGPEELDETWRDLFGSDRPRRVWGHLLVKALGYRLQEKAIGGLKPSTRRLLAQLGRNGLGRAGLAESARTRLKAGTVLVGEWRGVTHRVTGRGLRCPRRLVRRRDPAVHIWTAPLCAKPRERSEQR